MSYCISFTLLIELSSLVLFFFFFNDTATTEIYTLSLHDALPISPVRRPSDGQASPGEDQAAAGRGTAVRQADQRDRKSTRLNSSHANISYAVFCLKKKKKKFRMPVVHCIDIAHTND